MSGGLNQNPDRAEGPVRTPQEKRFERRFTALLGTTATLVAVAAVSNHAEMQVGVQVLDSCTVGTANPAAPSSGCAAQMSVRAPSHGTIVGTTGNGQASQEKTEDGVTSFNF